jgi:hypothetical protein
VASASDATRSITGRDTSDPISSSPVALDGLPQIRLAAHVAGEASVLAMGLVTDRAALAAFLDGQLAGIVDVDVVGVDVVLAERRRYWLDRDPDTGLGRFTPPSLL